MARNCNCAGSTCACSVVGAGGISVTGIGTAGDPFVVSLEAISLAGAITVSDSVSIDFSMLGAGTVADPFIISGAVIGTLVPDGGLTGQALVKSSDVDGDVEWATVGGGGGGGGLPTTGGDMTGSIGMNANSLSLRDDAALNDRLFYLGAKDGAVLQGNSGGLIRAGTNGAVTAAEWFGDGTVNFPVAVLVPTPTGGTQAANKDYVDDAIDPFLPGLVLEDGDPIPMGTPSGTIIFRKAP